MKGILTTKRKYINQTDAQAIISFQLPYYDWLKLRSSELWRQLEEKILENQNRDTQKSHQVRL